MYADKYVKNKNDIPTEPHWAILKFSSINIPGDERSRTNPGHGYPAHNETVINYEVYLTEEKWVKTISDLETSKYSQKSFVAIKAFPAKIEHHITVEK